MQPLPIRIKYYGHTKEKCLLDTHTMHILRLPLSPASSFFFLSAYMKQITHPALDLYEKSYFRVCSMTFCATSEVQVDAIQPVSFLCHTLIDAKEKSARTGAGVPPPTPLSPLQNTARYIFSLQTVQISSRAEQTNPQLILKPQVSSGKTIAPYDYGYLLTSSPLTLSPPALHLPKCEHFKHCPWLWL